MLSFNVLQQKLKMAEEYQMALESVFFIFSAIHPVISNDFSSPARFEKVYQNATQLYLLDLAVIQDGGIIQVSGMIHDGGKSIFICFN
jgi:hypothetical protein